ncbi:MAG: undecaprenyl-diphosphate phosphatase, partial [Candidatus Komeilibacteria bacterium]|nr:undecaprenyl-diphosphate phosphatase [Candidatus Komeilibacteria bacterium]
LLFYKIVKTYLLGSNAVVLWSLAVGGVGLIIFELWHKEREGSVNDLVKLTYPQALLIGLFQSIAMIPGVSRSAATIVGGLILGVSRTAIVEFSFLLAVPTMAAATLLDLVKNIQLFSSSQMDFLIVGFITAFIAALIAIKFLLHFIRNHTFIPFGIYRIIIAVLLWIYFGLL